MPAPKTEERTADPVPQMRAWKSQQQALEKPAGLINGMNRRRLLLMTLLVSCGPLAEAPPPGAPAVAIDAGAVDAENRVVSYQRDVAPVWARHCLECHFTPRPPSKAFPISPLLDAPDSRARLLAVVTTCVLPNVTPFPQIPLVVPGAPEASALTDILDRRARWGCWGTTMPRSQPGSGKSLKDIAPEDFNLVWRWILQGAPDN